MRFLVTGCAGFIGSHIVDRLLSEGHSVIGIDCFTDYYSRKNKEKNISQSLANPDFTLLEKDICDMECFPDVDFVFHESAQAGVRASWGSSFEIYTRNNIESTQHLLEWYKKRPLRKFVYASSSSVYGDTTLPMHESLKLQPLSPYGVTKLAAEHLCYLYWKNFGIPTVSLRYFTVYGPRQRPDMAINKFFRALQSGQDIEVYGNGEQTRDFTYISDIVDANILAADSTSEGVIFNVGGGSRITVIDLIHHIEDITGIKASLVYRDTQKGDVTDTLADISRIRSILRWNPKIAIRQGLFRYHEWLMKA